MLGAIFEGIFQIVLELLFEVAGELLSEIGLKSFENARRSATFGPLLFGTGYVVFGGALGALSYFILPRYLIPVTWLRTAGFIVSPLFMGLMLCLVSWFVTRKDRGEGFFAIDKFLYGVVFGVSYTVARSVVL